MYDITNLGAIIWFIGWWGRLHVYSNNQTKAGYNECNNYQQEDAQYFEKKLTDFVAMIFPKFWDHLS